MEIEEYVGKTVLFNCTQDFIHQNRCLLQKASDSQLFYCKVISHDERGVWVENPNWESRPARGGDPQHHKANILVPWRFVISLATFPERKFPADTPIDEKEATSIGFRQ